LEEFGFGWGQWSLGLVLMVIGWIVFGCLMALILRATHPDFELFAPAGIRSSFRLLLIYTGLTAVIFCGLEVLFQGLVMTLWKQRFGRWAILVQALLFWAWLAFQGSSPETAAGWYILVSIPLWSGCIAWYSQSLFIAFLFSFGASILLNSLLVIFV